MSTRKVTKLKSLWPKLSKLKQKQMLTNNEIEFFFEITKNPFTIETLEDDNPNTLTFIIRGERNTEYNVVIYLKKRLGGGSFGDVFKGAVFYNDSELFEVAIKKEEVISGQNAIEKDISRSIQSSKFKCQAVNELFLTTHNNNHWYLLQLLDGNLKNLKENIEYCCSCLDNTVKPCKPNNDLPKDFCKLNVHNSCVVDDLYNLYIYKIVLQVIESLECLYNVNNKFIYTDLKPENLLYKIYGSDIDKVKIYLGDLGSASGITEIQIEKKWLFLQSKSRLHRYIFSPLFMPIWLDKQNDEETILKNIPQLYSYLIGGLLICFIKNSFKEKAALRYGSDCFLRKLYNWNIATDKVKALKRLKFIFKTYSGYDLDPELFFFNDPKGKEHNFKLIKEALQTRIKKYKSIKQKYNITGEILNLLKRKRANNFKSKRKSRGNKKIIPRKIKK